MSDNPSRGGRGQNDGWPRDDASGGPQPGRGPGPGDADAWGPAAETGWGSGSDDGWDRGPADGAEAARQGSAGAGAPGAWGPPAETGWGRPNVASPFIAAQQPASARHPNGAERPGGEQEHPGHEPARPASERPGVPPRQPEARPHQQGMEPHQPGVGPYQQGMRSQQQEMGPHQQGAGFAAAGPGRSAAPTTDRRRRRGVIGLFVVLAIVVAGAIGWGAAMFFTQDDSGETTVASSPTGSASPSPSGGPSAETTPTAESSPELPDDPKEALDQIVDRDRPSVVKDLNGKWVPQLSSKRVGLEAEGKTWKEADILAEYEEFRNEYPRVQLVWSGDFSSFKEDDFWVTVVGIGYSDPEDALAWCSSNGLGPDHCYAKQLNTSGGYEGTTRLQD